MLGVEHEGLQLGAGQPQQGHGQGRLLFQFVGAAIGAGADHAAADAANPMARLQALAQQRQQPRQVAGIGGGAKHQGQIRLAAAATASPATRSGAAAGAELAAHLGGCPLEGHIVGKGRAAAGRRGGPPQPLVWTPGAPSQGEAWFGSGGLGLAVWGPACTGPARPRTVRRHSDRRSPARQDLARAKSSGQPGEGGGASHGRTLLLPRDAPGHG